ncbi:MAG: retropepsin-like aspartic protease [Chitinophagaceae bacterium]
MNKYRYIAFFLLWTLPAWGQHTTLEEMNSLLEKKDFFTLKEKLSHTNTGLTTQDSLYFQASTQNALGNHQQSIAAIKRLSQEYATQMDGNVWINLLNILADDYIKIFDYKSTAACYAILLRKYRSKLSRDDIASYDNNYQLYKSLQNIAPQTVDFEGNKTVQMYRDEQNLWTLPITVNQKDTAHFIFDSGAGISTISSSAAQALGLRVIPVNITVSSANERQIMAQLGVAAEMRIGGAVFRNAVFLVVDDAMLQFPTINYKIEGIIGFPVIHAMHTITITRDGRLSINQPLGTANNANFYYQGNAIRILGIGGKDTLLFHLDTGAKQSELNKEYYDGHKSEVRSLSEKRKYRLGSAGGVTSYKTFQYPNFTLQIGSGKKTLPYIPVYPKKVSPYGNAVGQDYIQLFDKMCIDFDQCYVTFQ